MQTIVDLRGLQQIMVEHVTEDLPGGPPAGTIIVSARNVAGSVIIALPREVALSLHRGLDPWARAIHEETDHGQDPSRN